MFRALNAERIKLVSTRSPWWCLGVVIVLSLGITALVAWAATRTPLPGQLPTLFDAGSAISGISGFGVDVLMIMAALAVTNEYRFGVIRTTFQAIPNRAVVLAAKALLLGVLSAVVAAVLGFVAFYLGKAMGGSRINFDLTLSGDNARVLAGLPLYTFLCVVLAVAVGALLRQSAATIALLLLWPLVIEGVIIAFTGSFGRVVGPFLPFANGARVLTGQEQTMMTRGAVNWHWGPWASLGYFAVIVAIISAIAAYTVQKRDA